MGIAEKGEYCFSLFDIELFIGYSVGGENYCIVAVAY